MLYCKNREEGLSLRVLKEQGVALITALLLAVFLFLLGGFFLYRFQSDFFFQSRHEANEQAYYLALSGIDHYRTQPLNPSDPQPLDTPPFTEAAPAVVNLDSRLRFRVYGVDSPGVGTDIVSTGQILNTGGVVIAQRTMVVPRGIMSNIYER